MNPFNRGELPQGMIELFGIKGAYTPGVEPTVMPTVNLADMGDSPYLRFAIPVSRTTSSAAVAAENSVVGFRPGATRILQVLQLTFSNLEALTAKDVIVSLLTQANVTTAGLTEVAKLLDLSGPQAQTLRGSSIWAGSHTTTVGSGIKRFRLAAASSTLVWDIPFPGIVMFGNDPGGIPMLAVFNETQNQALDDVGCYGREWPLPG